MRLRDCMHAFRRDEPRVINDGVIAISVPNLEAKELLIGNRPERFVGDPHDNGYPAVLVRLADWNPEDLEDLIVEGWRAKAPKELVREYDSA